MAESPSNPDSCKARFAVNLHRERNEIQLFHILRGLCRGSPGRRWITQRGGTHAQDRPTTSQMPPVYILVWSVRGGVD